MINVKNINKKMILRNLLSIGLAIILLVLAFRNVDLATLLNGLKAAKLDYLLIAFIMMTFSYYLRGIRWAILLSGRTCPSYLTTFWITCIGYLGNYTLPARAGELLRTVYMARETGIERSYILATALTERIIDAGFLAFMIVILLPIIEELPDWTRNASTIMLFVAILVIIALYIISRLSNDIVTFVNKFPINANIRIKLIDILEKFLEGYVTLYHINRGLPFLAITLLIWALDIVIALAVANALGIVMSPIPAFLLLAALGLSSALPSTPGYVGIYQFVAVTILSPFGYSKEDALLFIIGFQAIVYVLVFLWGGIGFWYLTARNKSS